MRILVIAIALLAMAVPASAQPLIVVDPGHGGNDPGGTGTGMREKDIVLDVSKRFRDLLDADTADAAGGGSWSVALTRDTDVFISLSARSAFANSRNADRFMSVHANAFGNPQANGIETFSYGSTGNGANLRNLVQEEMVNAWGLTNRGNKVANFAVLRETAMPAELHELGFITNPTDAAKLASSAELQKAAEAHLRALQRHMGFAPYLPGTATVEPGEGSIEVSVFGPDGPLAGARVSVDGEELGTTDDSGFTALAGIEIGEHVIGAVADGFKPADRTLEVLANQAAATTFDLELIPEECDEADENCNEMAADVGGGCRASGAGPLPLGSGLLLLLVWGLRRREDSAATTRP